MLTTKSGMHGSQLHSPVRLCLLTIDAPGAAAARAPECYPLFIAINSLRPLTSRQGAFS